MCLVYVQLLLVDVCDILTSQRQSLPVYYVLALNHSLLKYHSWT